MIKQFEVLTKTLNRIFKQAVMEEIHSRKKITQRQIFFPIVLVGYLSVLHLANPPLVSCSRERRRQPNGVGEGMQRRSQSCPRDRSTEIPGVVAPPLWQSEID